MDILKQNVSFFIDLMTRPAKGDPPAGSSEDKISKLFILQGKGVDKVTGDATQIPVDKGHIHRYRTLGTDIEGMGQLFQDIRVTVETQRTQDGFQLAGPPTQIYMTLEAVIFRELVWLLRETVGSKDGSEQNKE